MDSGFTNNNPALEQAAILLLTLESESPGVTSKILNALSEDKAKTLLERMSQIGRVPAEKRQQAMQDFYGIALQKEYIFGGIEVTSKILKETFGKKANEYFKTNEDSYAFLETVPTDILADFLQHETDQCRLYLFQFLPAQQASELLGRMGDPGFAMKIMKELEVPSRQLLSDFDEDLADYFKSREGETSEGEEDRIQKVASIMEYMPRQKRDELMLQYGESNPEFAQKLKQYVFSFEEFLQVDDEIFKTILFEISDYRQIAVARVNTATELVEKINRCLTERTLTILESESIGLEKKVNETQIEDAKRLIVAQARSMEKKGVLKLRNG